MKEEQMKYTREDLKTMQGFSLQRKVGITQTRIIEFVEKLGIENCYVSFSGGKDSTVLLFIARMLYPNIKAIYCDTGLEYPEIKVFAKKQDNVKTIRPSMNFREVIFKYGYPFISKEVAKTVYYARKHKEKGNTDNVYINKLNGTLKHNGETSMYCQTKYLPLLDVNFIISNKCCNVMKKAPFKKLKNQYSIIGSLAEESQLREQKWINNGCNMLDGKKKLSNPLSIWLEKDILEYIDIMGIEICSVYGEIEKDLIGSPIGFTGCKRTGCIFCGFGTHLESESRFKRLKKTHPKLYDYCMRGGEVCEDGIFRPTKDGLGYKYVIDTINSIYSRSHGRKFIEY